jgi:hypothetical protein
MPSLPLTSLQSQTSALKADRALLQNTAGAAVSEQVNISLEACRLHETTLQLRNELNRSRGEWHQATTALAALSAEHALCGDVKSGLAAALTETKGEVGTITHFFYQKFYFFIHWKPKERYGLLFCRIVVSVNHYLPCLCYRTPKKRWAQSRMVFSFNHTCLALTNFYFYFLLFLSSIRCSEGTRVRGRRRRRAQRRWRRRTTN